MKIHCFLELPNGFIDEYEFKDYESFCKFKEINQDIKFGKPRFDEEFILGEE